MTQKPTYEELEQRVKDLQKEVVKRQLDEKALRESEERYRNFVVNASEGIYRIDFTEPIPVDVSDIELVASISKHAIVGEVNEALARMYDLQAQDMIGRPATDFAPEYGERAMLAVRALRHQVRNVETLDLDREGDVLYLSESYTAVVEKGILVRIWGMQQNITDRKQTEKALQESEEQYRNLYDNALVGMWRSRISNGKLLKTNNVHATMSGFSSPEEALDSGFELSSLYPAERRKELTELLKKNGSVSDFEAHLTYPDGREQDISISAKVFPKKDYMEGVVIDITERKQAEKALHESEEKFRTLVEKSPLGISLIGENGLYKYINPQFTEIFGYTLDDVPTGTAWFKRAFPDKNFRQKVIETWVEDQKNVNVGQARPRIFTVTCKDGSRKDINFRPVTMENLEQFVIYEDITEKSKLEHQLQQSQKFEAIGTLAGGIAHDFNNLLMGIQGRTSTMLMNMDASDADFEQLKEIENHVESASELTRQLLGFAMGGKYEVKPTNLNELIENQNRMFGRTKKEVIIKSKYQENVWPVEIDRGQINQVLLNLYVNAWQAMPGGGNLYLETENVILDEDYVKPFETEPGRYVKISISDTGVGMDKATQERIFDPFFTTKEMGRGTGLGLASAYGIIKNHLGFINVYSEKDNGSIFNIYLPASLKEVIEEKKKSGDTLMGSETVLFVDDEDMIIEVTEQLLTRLGYMVFIARSGKEALEIYEENCQQIDLVVLDMIMPDMGGGDTYDGLKRVNSKVRVLLSSGYSIDGQATEILDRGCNGFIQKPFKMKEFSQKLRNILDKE